MLLPDDVLYAVLNRAAGERRTTEEVLSELTENDLDQMVAAGKLEVLPLPPSRGSSGESD